MVSVGVEPGSGGKITLEVLVEWSDFATEAEQQNLLFETNCARAKELNAHKGACFEGGRKGRVPVRLPGRSEPSVLTVDEVWEYLGDEVLRWNGMPLLQRLDQMGLCRAGFVDLDANPRLGTARWIIQQQIRAEVYGQLPQNAPEGLWGAFEIVRTCRMDLQARKMKPPSGG